MKVAHLPILLLALLLPACNTDLGQGTKKKNEDVERGLALGDEGNFVAPTATPTPDPEVAVTAAPTINEIPGAIGNIFDLTGTAEPEADIGVFAGEELLAETTADGTGTWLAELEDLPSGPIVFTALAKAPGKDPSASSEPRSTTVAEPLAAPVITGPVGETSGIGVILTGTTEEGAIVTARVQGPGLNSRNGWIQVDTTGTGGGEEAEADGLWTGDLGAELPTPLSVNATYRAYATAYKNLGEAGIISSPDSPVFFITVRNAAAPPAPTITSVVETEGAFWPLTISGTGVPGGEVAVFLEEAEDVDDGVPWRVFDSTTADGTGAWTYSLEEIPGGEYLIAVRGKNPENLYGDSSEVVELTAPDSEAAAPAGLREAP